MSTPKDNIRSPVRKGSIEFVIEERSKERVVSRMPVHAGILNPFGVVQAGAFVWLADVTASVLLLEAQPMDDSGKGFPLAIDLHTTLLGNQREGEIVAEASFVRHGRTVSVVRTRILGTNEKLLAEITSTHVPAR